MRHISHFPLFLACMASNDARVIRYLTHRLARRLLMSGAITQPGAAAQEGLRAACPQEVNQHPPPQRPAHRREVAAAALGEAEVGEGMG